MTLIAKIPNRPVPPRALIPALVLAIATVLVTEQSRGFAATTQKSEHARKSSATSIHDSAELHLISADGNTLIEEGKVTGTLPGTARVKLTINPARRTATSQFTLLLHAGTLTGQGHGSASVGKDGWESFGGTMAFDGGTGRYEHASGSGNLYGAIYRVNDHLKVQVVAQLHL